MPFGPVFGNCFFPRGDLDVDLAARATPFRLSISDSAVSTEEVLLERRAEPHQSLTKAGTAMTLDWHPIGGRTCFGEGELPPLVGTSPLTIPWSFPCMPEILSITPVEKA